MDKNEFIISLAKKLNKTFEETEFFINEFFNEITISLKTNENINFDCFGKFYKKNIIHYKISPISQLNNFNKRKYFTETKVKFCSGQSLKKEVEKII